MPIRAFILWSGADSRTRAERLAPWARGDGRGKIRCRFAVELFTQALNDCRSDLLFQSEQCPVGRLAIIQMSLAPGPRDGAKDALAFRADQDEIAAPANIAEFWIGKVGRPEPRLPSDEKIRDSILPRQACRDRKTLPQ